MCKSRAEGGTRCADAGGKASANAVSILKAANRRAKDGGRSASPETKAYALYEVAQELAAGRNVLEREETPLGDGGVSVIAPPVLPEGDEAYLRACVEDYETEIASVARDYKDLSNSQAVIPYIDPRDRIMLEARTDAARRVLLRQCGALAGAEAGTEETFHGIYARDIKMRESIDARQNRTGAAPDPDAPTSAPVDTTSGHAVPRDSRGSDGYYTPASERSDYIPPADPNGEGMAHPDGGTTHPPTLRRGEHPDGTFYTGRMPHGFYDEQEDGPEPTGDGYNHPDGAFWGGQG